MKNGHGGARPVVGMLLGLLAFAAGASDIDVSAGAAFAAQRAQVERQLRSGERYSEMSTEDRARVMTLLAGMADLIGTSEEVRALDPPDQVALFNQQEEANRLLSAAAEDSRVVCRRERMTGSNFPVNQCQTVAQRRAGREGGRQMMEQALPAQERVEVR